MICVNILVIVLLVLVVAAACDAEVRAAAVVAVVPVVVVKLVVSPVGDSSCRVGVISSISSSVDTEERVASSFKTIRKVSRERNII